MIHAADLFAGAGGASTGLHLAATQLGVDLNLVAINHWPAAVRTHAANHPNALHLCQTVESVDPREVVPGGRLHLLLAGPECVHHSRARGGRPVNDQSRASAWHLLRWLELLTVDRVLIENVVEFEEWAPIGSNGRPLKSRKGETFRTYLQAIRSLNYRVEAMVLNAADYGEATTRRRLFIQAARGRRAITWPEPTHSKRGGHTLLRRTQPWRPAREVIDWALPSQSIFGRARPLSPNTLKRIKAGLRRFGGAPFVLGQQGGGAPRSTNDPLPTVTTDGAISCVEPFLLPNQGNVVRSIDRPMPTITAEGGRSIGLVEPFVVQITHGGREHELGKPLPTITGGSRGDLALVEPFTMPYYSNGGQLARPVSQPVGTITTRDRFALVISDGVDIRFRMLQPHELAAAMGFPAGYQFLGTKTETIRMIGNAWSCRVAQALCACLLRDHARVGRTRREEAIA
ncbi:MAG: DNA cytosine methyltransferase [Acidobacteria bacterium]|nr:DNA cytosine methyltransferase [Acidobacteriota bacterium]